MANLVVSLLMQLAGLKGQKIIQKPGTQRDSQLIDSLMDGNYSGCVLIRY